MTEDSKDLLIKFTKIGNEAVRKAQEKNRELGIPNVYSINGIMVYEYDGKISMTPPEEWEKFNPAEEH